MRTALIWTYRVSLATAIPSLFYLLFMFGHVEPEVTGQPTVLVAAIVVAISGSIAGLLHWIGLPAPPPPAKNKPANAAPAGKAKH
jgi:hypothetical protein